MKLSSKLSAPLLFAFLVPLVLQAQFNFGGGDVTTAGDNNAGQEQAGARIKTHADSVQYKVAGGSSSTAAAFVNISNDSATSMLKATHAQVFFVDHVRTPKKAASKLSSKDIVSIEVAYGDPLIKQYGNEAKDGVFTILTRVKPKSAGASKNKSKSP